MNKRIDIVKDIAKQIDQLGGKVFYVGGFVRDRYLNIESEDIDVEVYGISEEQLKDILTNYSKVLYYGKSFGIYSLKGYNIDFALPRKERPTGNKHTDFDITIDPYLSYEDGARRRDFTINALMQDVLSDEIYDYFDGLNDLKKGILRCVNPNTFIEDPLRVLRACQFAARFNFDIDENTVALCSKIDISLLSKERVEAELKKALLKANKPSIFFDNLRKMKHLSFWFKEINDLIGIKQDPIYHPEGDVYTHTMEVIDRSSKYLNKVSNPYYFMLLALTHDLGKITTTEIINGRIHSYNHEFEGLVLVKSFIKRLTNEKDIMKYLNNMIPLHMRPLALAIQNSSIKKTNKLFDEAICPKDLIYFALVDKKEVDLKYQEYLFDRYDIFLEIMSKDYVKGDDLIAAGLKPDNDFKQILEFAHKLRLAGVNKEDALKQCLNYKIKPLN